MQDYKRKICKHFGVKVKFDTKMYKYFFLDIVHLCTQANSENCGPPLGNKFDL